MTPFQLNQLTVEAYQGRLIRLAVPIIVATSVLTIWGVYYVGSSAQGQEELEKKTLVVPIYSQRTPWSTTVSITEVADRSVFVTVWQRTATGQTRLVGPERIRIRENSGGGFTWTPAFEDPELKYGWAQLVYPADRNLHVVARTIYYEDYQAGVEETEAYFEGVEPARTFRLFAHRFTESETGVVVVNPTEEDQTVTVRFYPSVSGRTQPVLEQTWTIQRRHRLSRFLSELLPLEDEIFNHLGHVSGVMRITGETSIAVGALDFNYRTERFRSTPVVAEVPEPQSEVSRYEKSQ